MRKLLYCLLTFALLINALAGCGKTLGRHPATPSDAPHDIPDKSSAQAYIKHLIDNMSLEEQVSQLFMISLGPKDSTDYNHPNERVMQFLSTHTPGGYILFGGHISTVDGTKELTDAITANTPFAPFIGIDEEGGRISRLREAGLPGYATQPTAQSIGQSGDTQLAYDTGASIGAALKSLGICLDFAPDADVLTNPDNTVIGDRSFGSESAIVSDMVSAFQSGLHSQGILTAPKHFPGHGGTSGDSHNGMVTIDADENHLRAIEYPPFVRAITEGAQFVLVGHIVAPAADSSALPATLSSYFLTDVLRNSLGFTGIIITDAMDMGAIAETYEPVRACIMALQAGVDMILMPSDYEEAIAGILQAIQDGTLTLARIHTSLERILMTKIVAGLLTIKP